MKFILVRDDITVPGDTEDEEQYLIIAVSAGTTHTVVGKMPNEWDAETYVARLNELAEAKA